MTFGLGPLLLRIIALAALCAALAAACWHWAGVHEQIGFDRATALHEQALQQGRDRAQAQADAHRTQMRKAEASATKQIATTQATLKATRDALIYATQSLAACTLGADAVRMLNNAAAEHPNPTSN